MKKNQFSYFIGLLSELFIITLLYKENYITVKWRYKSMFGEIDVIAINFKLKEIVFIEIKFRESSEYYSIFESITVRQQKRIFKSAEVFLSTIYPNYKDYKIRFDAYFVKNDFDFEYFKDAWRDY